MQNNQLPTLVISSLLLTSNGFASVENKDTNEKPNIVIILADDLGWGNVGFHGSEIKTPNLDQLAHDGVQMSRFYTAPISSPTRAGLMTGRYPTRLGIRENVIPPWRDFGLNPQEEIIPEMLAKAGYLNRAIIGKWHLGHSRVAYHPLSNGFTHFYGHLNGAIDYFTHKREDQLDWHNDWESSYDEGYSTDLIAQEAVNCIKQYANEGPFFLYVAFNAPHTPLQAKPEDLALYTDDVEKLTPKQKKIATYAAMVTCMDSGIGEIRNTLRELGIEDNTLLLFFSDNGAEPNGGGSNQPLKGAKFQEWDGGLRVPAIVSYPAKFKGNRVIDQVVGFVDIMPTIQSLVNITDNVHLPFDGIDITPILSGETKTINRDLYLGCGTVVNNDYKFILQEKNEKMGLKNDFLSFYPADPFEETNFAEEHKAEALRLKSLVQQYDATEPAEKLPPFNEGRAGFVAPMEWKITPKQEIKKAIEAHKHAVYIKDGWIRDPYIYLAPDGYYYLTGTTPLPNDPREKADPYNLGLTPQAEKLGLRPSIVGYKLRVWRSSDLAEWEYLGEAFSLEQGFWAKQFPEAFRDVPNDKWLLWAPEIFFVDGKWVCVLISPNPVQGGSNLIVKNELLGDQFEFPMEADIRTKHDPSLFQDDDGTWYLSWGNTFIAPLHPGFSGLAAKPVRIDPSDRVIGHEGATIRKIGKKYVHFGTAWSTDKSRKGSYNLYYCTSDSVMGPYGERRFVGRFLGHGTPFCDKSGQWWCTAFFNANVPPIDDTDIRNRDLSENALTINQQGTTIVPLEVKILPDGDVYIRAIDERYAYPGPDEVQHSMQSKKNVTRTPYSAFFPKNTEPSQDLTMP